MKKYKVVFAIFYTVKADSADNAIEKAIKEFVEELNEVQNPMDMFGIDVELIE